MEPPEKGTRILMTDYHPVKADTKQNIHPHPARRETSWTTRGRVIVTSNFHVSNRGES